MWGSIHGIIAAEVSEIAACWRQAGDGPPLQIRRGGNNEEQDEEISPTNCQREHKAQHQSRWFYRWDEGVEVRLRRPADRKYDTELDHMRPPSGLFLLQQK